MKSLRFLFILMAVSMLTAAASAQAGKVKVIANSSVSVSSISSDDLKNVFLETKTSLAGGHVEPVLQQGGAAHEEFLKAYIDKSPEALERYYRAQLMAGNAMMPKTVSSDAEVLSYVAKTKGAIGYVSAAANTAGVKTLDVN